ncbi:restriction endonuclease subunit S, partial [Bacillus safensis]
MNAQDLKNSILQLAIQGKLVEHREEEGTAKELLEKKEAEKKQLIKEGKIKKQKTLPSIKDDEIPFDIPQTWEWARMGNVIDFINGRAYKKEELKDKGK